MVLGAVTSTYVGEALNGSTALKALFDSINTGSATAGADTTSIIVIPVGSKVSVWKIVRAGA